MGIIKNDRLSLSFFCVYASVRQGRSLIYKPPSYDEGGFRLSYAIAKYNVRSI